MELPFTVVFEPPSRRELRALLRMRGQWVAGGIVALAIGAAYVLASVARADSVAGMAVAPLQVTSHPAGAEVWVDGQQRGWSPLALSVSPGPHSLALKRPQALDQQYAVNVSSEGAALEAVLWRRQPQVSHLRPALPGAVLADARLLSDGDLGLSIGLPPGDQLEAWRLDPRSGALDQLLPAVAGKRLVFAADGRHLAYLGPDVGPLPGGPGRTYAASGQPPPAAVVWLVSLEHDQSAAIVGWRPPLEPAERLIDISWSPDARRVLVVSALSLGGDQALSRAWLVDADGQAARAVLSLPSQVAPGTEAWSPNGAYIAFVAHAGQLNALCLLDSDGGFRYVADLDTSSTAPLEFPSATWSADGQRLLFVAPHQHVPGSAFDWLAHDPQHSLYVAAPDQPLPIGMADTRLDQVAWREDGQVLGLWRGAADTPLHIRLSDPGGGGGGDRDLLTLPLQAGAQYAASWDLARAELVVATRASGGGGSPQFWLVRLGVDDGP